MARNPTTGANTLVSRQQVDSNCRTRRKPEVLLRLFVGTSLAIAATIGLVGCSGSAEQARRATLEAEQAELKAEQAEAAANQARAAAQQAELAADRAQKAVDDASREINRVAEHLDRMGYGAAGSD
jgi:hypothetical protein